MKKLVIPAVTLSEVNKKNLKIFCYLVGSWAVALALSYISGNEKLVGLAPALNFVVYLLEKEVKGEGYVKALKK